MLYKKLRPWIRELPSCYFHFFYVVFSCVHVGFQGEHASMVVQACGSRQQVLQGSGALADPQCDVGNSINLSHLYIGKECCRENY